jgi:hypothetical protein
MGGRYVLAGGPDRHLGPHVEGRPVLEDPGRSGRRDPGGHEAAAAEGAEHGGPARVLLTSSDGVADLELDADLDVGGGADANRAVARQAEGLFRLNEKAGVVGGVGPVAPGAAVGREDRRAVVHRGHVGSTIRQGRYRGKEQP